MAEGKKLLEKKDAPRAILQFRNAVQANPKDPEAYYQLALACLTAGDVRQGVVALRKTLDLNPKHAGAELHIAQLMAATVDPDMLKDAQQRLNGLLEGAPDDPRALHALALTELKLGEPEDAIQHLARAATAAPGELIIAVTMAQAKLQQRDAKGAEQILQKAVENSPKSADAHLVFADFYFSQKKTAEAEEQLKRALEIDPKSGPALMSMGRLQLVAGRKREAEQSFKQLSGFAGYESIYGLFLSQEGRRDEAVQEFESLRKAHPEDRQIRTHLVAAYQGVNRLNDAKKILADVLKKNPNDLDALVQRGELLMGSGDYPEAEADLNKVLKLKADSPQIHYVVAKLNQARGNDLIYREELSEALKLNPYLLTVRLEAAQDLISGGNAKTAIDVLDQAPAFQRASVTLAVTRNWALWELGDLPAMRKGIDAALSRARSEDLVVQDGLWQLRSGKTAQGRAALAEALKMNPADVRAMGPLADTYVAQKQLPLAIQKVREYAAGQKSAAVQELLGSLLFANGDRDSARVAFLAAKAADPKFVRADFSLAQLDVAEKKWIDARARLTPMLSSKQAGLAHLWLAKIEETSGNQELALQHFRKAVDADSRDVEALNGLAYLLADYANRPDEALKYAEEAVQLAPDQPLVADTLGWVLYRKGLYPSAILQLTRGAAQKDCAVCQYHLAMAYAKAGESEHGRAILRTALKLNPNLPEAKVAVDLLRDAQ